MTQGKLGWNRQLMVSAFTKEATYDAGITHSTSTSCSLVGYEFTPEYTDKVVNDKDEVTGYEHGTRQEIISYGNRFTLKFAKLKPNDLAFIASLVLGSSTPSQDPGKTAYRHKIVPVTVGTELPSCALVHLDGGIQTEYTGIKGSTLKISGEEGGILAGECGMIGSGTRAANAESFVASISESWMLMSGGKVWLETGTDRSISAAATQGTEDISSATPDNLSPRVKSFEFGWNNNLQEEPGVGGAGVLLGLSYGRRALETAKIVVRFNDATEAGYYTSQAGCSVELDFKGALIASGGTMYFGCQLVLRNGILKAYPKPEGGAGDILTQTLDWEALSDSTGVFEINVYTAQAAYLA